MHEVGIFQGVGYLVQEWLCKDPDDRYFNCEALHQDLFGRRSRRRTQILPGRAAQQAQLRRMERGLIWISGEAGCGKSALAQSWLEEQRNRRPQALVLRAKCQPSEEPFGVFQQLIEDGLRQLRRLPDIQQVTWQEQLAGLFNTPSGELQ